MSDARHVDVIVVGLGAMGSQTLAHLARRGIRAMGFDRFSPPHDQGSSHGKSRIIREAYFEDPIYVPLVRRAYECWTELEAESGTTLFRRTGGLCYGPAAGELVSGARRSAELHGVAHESLDAAALRARFPAFVIEDDWVGVLESRAGILDPERAISAAIDVARRHGASVRTGEPVLRWRQEGEGVVVETAEGSYRAGQLVLSAGMWIGELVRELNLPLVVQRNAVYWFEPRGDAALFAPDRFPVFLGDLSPELMLYGFPDTGDGVKVALHHFGPPVSPDASDRTVGAAEIDHLRGLLQRYLPAANGPLRATGVCTYTNLPDEHFLIDRHPQASCVWIASPCSGHGFKFSSAIGELLADLLTTGRAGFDLAPFAIGRFGARKAL